MPNTCFCPGLSLHLPQLQSHHPPTTLDSCIPYSLTVLPAVLSSPCPAESGTPKSSPECRTLCTWPPSVCSQSPKHLGLGLLLSICVPSQCPIKVYPDKPSPPHLSLNLTHLQPVYPGPHGPSSPSLRVLAYVRAPQTATPSVLS